MRKVLFLVAMFATFTVSAQKVGEIKYSQHVVIIAESVDTSAAVPLVPLSYTDWTQWSRNDICCTSGLIIWQSLQIGLITASGGTYVGTEEESRQDGDVYWQLRYRIKYFASGGQPLTN